MRCKLITFVAFAIAIICACFSWHLKGWNEGVHHGREIGFQEALAAFDLNLALREELDRQRLQYNPEERIGGGYRDGKFVYLKDVAR